MSRLPNPFSKGQGSLQQTPRRSERPSTPGFLLLTRPPTGANSYGGASYQSPLGSSQSFIPFSSVGGSDHNTADGNRRNGRENSNKFGYGRGGGGRQGNYSSPRFAYPYQQSPGGRMPSPRGQEHGFSNSPGTRLNSPGMRYSTPRGNFSNSTPGVRFHSGGRGRRGRFNDRQERSFSDHNRSNPNGSLRGGRTRGMGPISSIPIDKFVSESMIQDPWAGLIDEPETDSGQMEESGPAVIPLEDSEIIIDSDTSAVVGNSFDDVVSDTEVDSSPVHDTGSDNDSPNIATSSTSEKDTGSDSGSDTE